MTVGDTQGMVTSEISGLRIPRLPLQHLCWSTDSPNVFLPSRGPVSTTIEELSKASNSLKIAQNLLKHALSNEPTNIELHKLLRDGSIQRFEFCIELAWKVSMKALGLTVLAPLPAIRDMARNNLIDEPQIWFDFLTARNKTSHTYDEEIAKVVYAEVEKLIPELERLISKLQSI